MARFDLLLRGGTVVDPAHGVHERRDVGLRGDRVVACAPGLDAAGAARVVDVDGLIVTPGLIDLHVHVFPGVTHYGIPADPHCLARGVTTAVDAGSAGADTLAGFRRYVIDVSDTRLYTLVNLSRTGMVDAQVGELEDLRLADPAATARAAREHGDVVVGVKARLSRNVIGGNDSLEVLRLARRAADEAALPIMIHVGDTTAPLGEILPLLEPGDIVTHCYHGREHGVLDEVGRVRPEVRAAVARGVLLDVGHGRGSFSFDVARRCLEQGVPPGSISSDIHVYNCDGPVFDLATTLSKFMLLGLPLEEVVRLATVGPARAARLSPWLGHLGEGAAGDVAVFERVEGRFAFKDSQGASMQGHFRLEPRLVVRGGRVRGIATTAGR